MSYKTNVRESGITFGGKTESDGLFFFFFFKKKFIRGHLEGIREDCRISGGGALRERISRKKRLRRPTPPNREHASRTVPKREDAHAR